jgi:hypothetical protein
LKRKRYWDAERKVVVVVGEVEVEVEVEEEAV